MSSSSRVSSGRRVIILGAGIHGLAAAKTYLEIVPDVDLTIIDNDDSVGGVWSRSRVHSNLVVDSASPSFEFSDLQMKTEFDIPDWTAIPGPIAHQYFHRYAEKFDLLQRCIFNTEVMSVERDIGGWEVLTRGVGANAKAGEKTFVCDVLMVAVGNFSVPMIPDIDTSLFDGITFHTKDLRKRAAELASEDVQTVAVVGGNKSAFEAVCLSYKAGKKVHWLIRPDGAGTGLLMEASLPDGTTTSKIGFMRIFGLLVPDIYRQHRNWWDRLVVSGRYSWGRKLFDWFWNNTTMTRIGDRYEKSTNGKLLKPDILSLFWTPTGLSLVHNSDLNVMEAIHQGGRIHVARTRIKSMEKRTLHLTDGTSINVDTLIFATGWKEPVNQMFTPKLAAQLGLSVPWESLSDAEAKYWKKLYASEDKIIVDLYPLLDNPPYKYVERDSGQTPFRLFRALLPPTLDPDCSKIVFLGKIGAIHHPPLAEINALWSVAYLEGLLPLEKLVKDEDAMRREIARVTAFMKRRYPGRRNIPHVLFEIQDWNDLLLRDLGLRTDRNRLVWERSADRGFGWFGVKGWMIEWFKAYEPVVYKGIVQEFLESVNKQEEGKKTR